MLCVTAGGVVGAIPMAALVAVMLVIAVTTFDWRSVAPRSLRLMPRSETLVMLVTVVGTLATHNLAVGVVLGVLTAMVAFARRVAHLTRSTSWTATGSGPTASPASCSGRRATIWCTDSTMQVTRTRW